MAVSNVCGESECMSVGGNGMEWNSIILKSTTKLQL